MKISKFLLNATFGLLYVNAQANEPIFDSSEVPIVDIAQSDEIQAQAEELNAAKELNGKFAPPMIANFSISYTIGGNEVSPSSVIEVENEENVLLSYTFKNSDDMNVNVVALGGVLQNLATGEIAGEFSKSPIGPINVPINTSATFNQDIDLSTHEGDFYMIPHVYVLKDDSEMRVAANPTFLKVLPPRMSFFDPKFLSIQFFIAILIGLSTYYLSDSSASKRKRTTQKAMDTSQWLPETHKKNS